MKHSRKKEPTRYVSEKELLGLVTDIAEAGRWLVYHTYDSRRSQRGFPDLVMTRDGRVIFAELKSQKGRVRPEQQHWLDELNKVAGVEVYLWRPSDSDTIEKTLLGRLSPTQ
jgi:hypothetical protein